MTQDELEELAKDELILVLVCNCGARTHVPVGRLKLKEKPRCEHCGRLMFVERTYMG